MALFKRKPVPAPEPRETRIEVSEESIPRAVTALARFERAFGGPDAPLREAVRALSEAAGGQSLERLVMSHGDINRPWLWLAGVAEFCVKQGEYELPGRVYLFAAWFRSLKGKLRAADYMDMWLDPVRDPEYARIVSAAALSLTKIPGDSLVAMTPREQPRAADVLAAVSADLTGLQRQGVAVSSTALEAIENHYGVETSTDGD